MKLTDEQVSDLKDKLDRAARASRAAHGVKVEAELEYKRLQDEFERIYEAINTMKKAGIFPLSDEEQQEKANREAADRKLKEMLVGYVS